jgi:hypothetical protein
MAKMEIIDDKKLNELTKLQAKEPYIEYLIKIKNNV